MFDAAMMVKLKSKIKSLLPKSELKVNQMSDKEDQEKSKSKDSKADKKLADDYSGPLKRY